MTFAITTDKSWRTLDLEVEGAATNAEPAGWKDPGYDDSAWNVPRIPSGIVTFDITGADTICDSVVDASPRTGEAVWIARKAFMLSRVPATDRTLHLTCDNELVGAWINGTLIGTLPDVDNWTADNTFTVAAADFVVGENVLAFKITNSLPVPSTSFLQASLAFEAPAGVFADWDDDGFGAAASADDLTSYVKRWRISDGAAPEITGGAQPGSLSLTLKNTSDRFNPLNSGGPLYGKLTDGVPIWLGVNSDGTLSGSDARGLFGGRITDITPVPEAGATVSPEVEILAEDCLGWYDRLPVTLEYAEGRAHDEFRRALFAAASELRYRLAHEIATMPVSNADGDLLPILEAVNRATGSRHFCRAADSPSGWYEYATRNRFWRMDGTSDASIAADEHGATTNGWRLSADTVTNRQKVTVTPVEFTASQFIVWEAEKVPIEVTSSRPLDVWVEFDEYVKDPVLNWAQTGSTLVATLETFGQSAHITITRTGAGTGTITALTVEGSLARRLPTESWVADDAASQAGTRGIRAGSEISGDYVGTLASARGLAEHVVFRYGNPQFRPTLTVTNWIPEMFELEIGDVISLTSTQLGMTNRLFEIVGRTREGNRAASTSVLHHVATYVLQECAVQSSRNWFRLDSSLLDGTHDLHY